MPLSKGNVMRDENTAPAATEPRPSERATIFCCVERGRLERQTLLMLETLRRSGGPLGQSRVLAIVPRRGRRLAAETLARFRSLGVELHDASHVNRLPWYTWYAKVAATRFAEELATTPVLIWLDSDTLILGPLVELGLPHGHDFTARREVCNPAVYDDSSPFLDHWRFSSEAVGLDWSDIPWMAADYPERPQRLMFNAGVYAFRRGLGFPEMYADCTDLLIRAGVGLENGVYWFNEQHALMFAALRLGLRWRELSRAENHMIFDDQIDGEYATPSCVEARLVHYSRSMNPPRWPQFLARLRRERSDDLDWLAEHGPIGYDRRLPRHPSTLAVKLYRKAISRMQSRRSVLAVRAWKARQAVGCISAKGGPIPTSA